ncbi:MAG: CocE/NonD family hydrolase, partial [Nitrososphaerales archaeon]
MYKSSVMFDLKVPMRDGVMLSANVYFPKGDGPFPVLMNRTPYVKDSAARSTTRNNARSFAEAGYAVVHMDVRGRGDSEGTFAPYFQEIDDGYDSFEWAGTQSWSNGRVGTWGGSYEGWVQIFPMRLQSKHHHAAFLQCTPSMHPFHDCHGYPSGVPNLIMAMWAFFVQGKTLKDEITDKDFDWESMLNIRPLKEAMQRLGLSSSSTFSPFVDHETYDDFCKTLWNEEMVKLMSVPSYFVTGWFDDSIKGSLEHFPQMTQKHPDEQVRKSHKLLVGPWPHRLSIDSSKLGDFDYGPQSMVPLQKEATLWFDYWLKGVDNGIMKESVTHLFLMGENRWIESNAFPLSEAVERTFVLAAEGPTNSLNGGGKLGTNSGSSPASTFVYNPERPAPTPFWKENFQNGTNEDLRPIQRRDDVLVFSSDPLTSPFNLVGLISLELFVSTSATDTDFVGRLSDVSPDGYAERLNHGIFRLRYREGYEKIKL